MFTIGEFARHGRVSVRMLRYYDRLGLLSAQHVDPVSGYRYYGAVQLSRLNRLMALKDLGFTLRQIGTVLNEDVSSAELRGMLRLRYAELEAAIAADASRLRAVGARLDAIDSNELGDRPEVVVKRIQAVRVAEVSGPASSYAPSDITGVIQPLFDRLCGALEDAEVTASGPAVAYYTPCDIGVRVHACLPVRADVRLPDAVRMVDLPAITAATVVHHGPMDHADLVTQRLARWMDTHGHRSGGFAREVNLETPADHNEWVTEFQEPIETR